MVNTPFEIYCDAVCRRVRYLFARPAIREELSAHLEDRAEALCQAGVSPEAAAEQAVAAMGDPEETGRAFDRLYPPLWHWLARILSMLTCLLLAAALWGVIDRTLEQEWYRFPYHPEMAPVQYQLDSLSADPPMNERIVAKGKVTGGGRLGDYTFTPATEAWLVETPDYTGVDGSVQNGYSRLSFYLSVGHAQPWLGELVPDWANPVLADEGGTQYKIFDRDYKLSVGAWVVTPFTDVLSVSLLNPPLGVDEYDFSLTGPDGRVLSFHIAMTDGEVTP